jgi:hypothetical protein
VEEAFDAAEVGRYARNNAFGFSLLTVAYLRSRHMSVADWARWLGRAFAGPETNWVPGMGARKMAREAALEMTSCNSRVIDISGDDEASLVKLVWPSDDSLREFGLIREEVRDFWLVWEPIAASVGLRCESSTEANGVTRLSFTRIR